MFHEIAQLLQPWNAFPSSGHTSSSAQHGHKNISHKILNVLSLMLFHHIVASQPFGVLMDLFEIGFILKKSVGGLSFISPSQVWS